MHKFNCLKETLMVDINLTALNLKLPISASLRQCFADTGSFNLIGVTSYYVARLETVICPQHCLGIAIVVPTELMA